ncbi:hypothetical protein A0H81_07444 [Grifola frondosa]|uniref:BAR domain-containing protein n=1 Tax=Grifola frondosa TaxID=5627 RepID=A0A1C7M782_GRIFR|nr:hypothetical protein A0H81_07444 [Grifola frondosa]
MATSAAVPVLAERLDIHKSCKTLETVVNILNDYCEAANAIVALQKKLAKALRESASMKCTADIPANALNTSATIFEALSEVDSKFAKFADKECDGISTEVKKWFKKLSKAEKEHDARLATANGKIKAAVQAYERKAKKNPRDFAEEHTRYMNLLSTLGPEVNQDKYDHALFVTQRHSSTVYNLAACLSRMADAEWMRSFESVRKFSPTIGQLGEWRALCEGGWSGDVPGDLPDYNTGKTTTEPRPVNEHDSGEITGSPRPRELMPPTNEKPAPEYSSRDASEQENASRAVTPSGQSPVAPPQYFPEPGDKPEQHLERKSHSATSLASLASFPAPPTHFPIPPVSGAKLASPASIGPAKETETPSESRTSSGERDRDTGSHGRLALPVTPHAELATPITSPRLTAAKPSVETSLSNDKLVLKIAPTEESREFTGSRSNVQSASSPVSPSRKAAYVDDGEFGVRRSMDGGQQPKLRGAEPSLTAVVERSDTGKSQGSVVAALRDRYARPTVPSSPPPRGLPRLPTSVSSLANRYEPVAPTSPRHGTGSPAQERTRSSLDSFARMPDPPFLTEVLQRAGPRIEALEELELREREHDLRMKEREIEQRARELDREPSSTVVVIVLKPSSF